MTIMSWPIRLRAMSFAITVAVVAVEVAIVAIPVAAVMWLAGFTSARAAMTGGTAIALAYALAIAIYTHISPLGIRRRALNGDL
jgi:hypothetical protein